MNLAENNAALLQDAILAIQSSHRLLTTESDLSPNNQKVTQTLTHLVRTLTCCGSCSTVSADLVQEKHLAAERKNLPILCAKAECAMEKYWAQKIIESDIFSLSDFWYLAEYKAHCNAEAALLQKTYRQVTFLGAGALPLTAILMAELLPSATIVCVDFDVQACVLASKLIEKAGLASRIHVIHCDAADYMPVANELVICAALLEGAESVYDNVCLQADCDLIVRDSEGIFTFLYREARLPDERFVELGKTENLDHGVINISRYYRQKPR